jgi:hypothetical protein
MKVEKGIPIPRVGSVRGKYTALVQSMEVGDSILCDSDLIVSRLRAAFIRLKVRYSTRKVPGGFRIWRLADEKPASVLRAVK